MRLIIDSHEVLHGELRITLGSRETLVAEKFLNGTKIGTFLQHVRSESVTQRVGVEIRREAVGDGHAFDDAAHAARGDAASTEVN